ncbi:MAG: hypothetical protein ACRDRR_00320 [Pseudonocardiaceae bacterium]
MSIEPKNLTAQLHHRAAGNPPSTLPDAAISNSFPGLEFDFRNVWRRLFEGIEVHEARGFVVRAEGELQRLEGRFLTQVADTPILIAVRGPMGAQEDASLGSAFLEWSNAMAEILRTSAGQLVPCQFVDFDATPPTVETVELRIRPLFARSGVTDEPLPLIDEVMAGPGELTQSLCSPWQNDYRECGCYYWAASRPDYVNVESTEQGPSIGNNWMARQREPKRYEPDSASNPLQINYEDLFRDWQGLLRFIVGGRDYD